MAINEVFPNPTVKKVMFQIRFSNLFYIENKIGDLQMKLMKEFPESSMLYHQKFLLTNKGLDLSKESEDKNEEQLAKIWSFESKHNCRLNILSDSLDISSKFHKTYNNESSDNKFRDVINFVLTNFFEIIKIPTIKRIGLRYVDECPIPKKNTELFEKYYNTTFPLKRFKLEDSTAMQFSTVTKKGKHKLRFIEQLVRSSNKYKLILDFDSFSEDLKSEDCLKTTDTLHKIISKEYEKSLREPVFEHMRNKRK
jgi:uncharacterized protein (TIGR04255 family)